MQRSQAVGAVVARRAVLPSTANAGWSTPLTAAAFVRKAWSQLQKRPETLPDSAASTPGERHLCRGMPAGNGSTFRRNSFFVWAQRAIAVGPLALPQHCHQSDHDHAHQRVLSIDRGTRILQLMEMSEDSRPPSYRENSPYWFVLR